MANLESNQQLFAQLCELIPGGVNSPVRAFTGVGDNYPIIFTKASGAYLHAVDGKQYIDYIQGWGSIGVGHAHPVVVKAAQAAAADGLCFGAPTVLELNYAQQLCKLFGLDKVRAVCSGTEATMTAIRLARGVTGRNKLIKFTGCYHGHSDSLLVQAGSGALTLGNPSSAGVPKQVAEDTLVLPYNDSAALAEACEKYGNQLAGIIFETVAGNMNLVVAKQQFIQTIREQADQHGIIMIADEVMCGLRAAARQVCKQKYGIEPDLVCLGKLIGGGTPVAALGGKAKIMDYLAPDGPVYQAGTLSGNPVALAAGLAQLELLTAPGAYQATVTSASQLAAGINSIAKQANKPLLAQNCGSMLGLYFNDAIPTNLSQVRRGDYPMFCRFHHNMLQQGIYLPPSMYEACFIGLAHDETIIDLTLTAVERALAEI